MATDKPGDKKAKTTAVNSTVKDKGYDYSNFFDTSEVKKYESKLKEFNELLKDPKKILKALGLPEIDIAKLIEQVKSLFTLDNILNALGLDKLYKDIMKFVNDALAGFGLITEQLNSILGIFSDSCKGFNKDVVGVSVASSEALTEVVVANSMFSMACLGIDGALDGLKKVFPNASDNLLAKSIDSFVSKASEVGVNVLNKVNSLLGDATAVNNTQTKSSLLAKSAEQSIGSKETRDNPLETFLSIISGVESYMGDNEGSHAPTNGGPMKTLARSAVKEKPSGFSKIPGGKIFDNLLKSIF